MLQDQRNWLYNTAYSLDNRDRVRLKPREVAEIKPLTDKAKLKALVQEKTSDLYVLVSHKELENLAEELRQLAANDEDRIVRGRRCNFE